MRPAKLVALVQTRYDRDVTQTIATQGAMLVAALATSIITARFLGPEGRGAFFFVTTTATLIAQFGNFGLTSTNTFIVAKRHELLLPLTANALWLSLAIGVSAAVLMAAFGDRFTVGPSLLLFAAAIGGGRLFHLLSVNLLAGVQRFRSFNFFQLLSSVLLVAGVSVGAIQASVTSFLWGNLAAKLVTGLLVLRHIGGLSVARLRPKFELYRRHLHFSIKSYLILFFGFLMMRGNVFLMESLSSRAELGYYSVAVQIAEAMGLIATSMALVLYPRLVSRERGRFRYMFGYLIVIGLTMSILCVAAGLVAKPTIQLAFGAEFSPAVAPTLRLLPGVLFVGMHSIVAQYLAAEGQPAAVVGSWLLAVGVMAGIGISLIPATGAAGAALSLSIGYLFVLVANLTVAAVVAYRRQAGGPPPEAAGAEAR